MDSVVWTAEFEYSLVVQGVVDGVKDGNQKRTVEISASVNSTVVDFDLIISVGTVQVRYAIFFF